MGYRFRHDDESVEAGFRRIAGEQLGRAVASLEGDALHAGVHNARKRVKKVRGLLRLVRPGFKGFARENAALRDAARTVSGLRDHAAMIETLDRLVSRYPERVDAARVEPLRQEMEARRDEAAGSNDLSARIESFREVLGAAWDRAEGWRLKAAGWEALGPGLALTYGQGREAMAVAHKTGRGEDFHEFRKRVKDHGYHVRLLAPVWPVLMAPYAALVDDLGEVLGEQHDLVAFGPMVAGSALAPEARAALEDLIVEERRRLEARALVIGARVYAEKPKAMARRMGAWWAAWAADPSAVDQDDAKEPPSAASISAMLSSIP
ncbi:MAG: CHAD domain-containing protein [Rhodobacteraceae bacterium]|nr:CHAD domain-containing protein [Paracoccaceae bacterium]